MNFLGLRSQSTAPHALPPHSPLQAQPELNNRKPSATLEDLVAEDSFPLASLADTFDGRGEAGSENGAFGVLSTKNGSPVVDKHIDVCEEEGWITIPCKELPESWNEEPDMLSFKSFDRSFVFPGEQVHILACLSAYKQDTEIITPFKVAAMMSKNAKKQNGEVVHEAPVLKAFSTPSAKDSFENAGRKTDPTKDIFTGESLLRMEDHRRQTEMLLQRFRNSHFFARTAEADEPLWSKRKPQETFRESTEMIGGRSSAYDNNKSLPNTSVDRGSLDASTSGGVARNGFTCSSLANGDIVVLLQVNIGVDCLKDPVLEITQYEKYQEKILTNGTTKDQSYSHQDPCGDLLKWLLPLENSLPIPSRSVSPAQLSSSSSVKTTPTKTSPTVGSSGSPIFSFGHFRSYSMSAVPPSNVPPVSPITSATPSFVDLDGQDHFSSATDEKGEMGGLLSFRGVPLEQERFSVRCGLEGIYIPGRRWRRKVEIIQPVEIFSFAADCNTEDLLCVQIKNVCPAHVPDIVIYLDTITIIHEEASKGGPPCGPPLSLPIACIEAGNDHRLPDLDLRRGEEHSFILKPATSLWRNNKVQSDRNSRSSSVHFPSNVVMQGDKYAVLVSCRCNYTESRLFFKEPTSWRPRMPRDLLISVASQMSQTTLALDDRVPQLPVQVLTLEASNLTYEDLTLTLLAPASFTSLPSVVSLNSTPASPVNSFDSDNKHGIALNGPETEQTICIADVLPKSDLGCTHLWLQSRVPLGCVPCRSTATIKLELLPLTDGIITLDSLQISVKEKGLTYVPEQSLMINATSSISSGII
ncbi:uncharacterized protein [Rutidosis leptorrhynchoides]|uniref:uncharacterized protein n=1 Tax=Rutidosis leptorrhynchoides TaxID=125765 RepID=UPI003A993221